MEAHISDGQDAGIASLRVEEMSMQHAALPRSGTCRAHRVGYFSVQRLSMTPIPESAKLRQTIQRSHTFRVPRPSSCKHSAEICRTTSGEQARDDSVIPRRRSLLRAGVFAFESKSALGAGVPGQTSVEQTGIAKVVESQLNGFQRSPLESAMDEHDICGMCGNCGGGFLHRSMPIWAPERLGKLPVLNQEIVLRKLHAKEQLGRLDRELREMHLQDGRARQVSNFAEKGENITIKSHDRSFASSLPRTGGTLATVRASYNLVSKVPDEVGEINTSEKLRNEILYEPLRGTEKIKMAVQIENILPDVTAVEDRCPSRDSNVCFSECFYLDDEICAPLAGTTRKDSHISIKVAPIISKQLQSSCDADDEFIFAESSPGWLESPESTQTLRMESRDSKLSTDISRMERGLCDDFSCSTISEMKESGTKCNGNENLMGDDRQADLPKCGRIPSPAERSCKKSRIGRDDHSTLICPVADARLPPTNDLVHMTDKTMKKPACAYTYNPAVVESCGQCEWLETNARNLEEQLEILRTVVALSSENDSKHAENSMSPEISTLKKSSWTTKVWHSYVGGAHSYRSSERHRLREEIEALRNATAFLFTKLHESHEPTMPRTREYDDLDGF